MTALKWSSMIVSEANCPEQYGEFRRSTFTHVFFLERSEEKNPLRDNVNE